MPELEPIRSPLPIDPRPASTRRSRTVPPLLRTATLIGLAFAAACGSRNEPPDPFERSALQHQSISDRMAERIAAADSAATARGEELTVGVSLVDLATDERIGLGQDVPMHAASTMKVPVLFELFRQAEQGRLSLDDQIVLRNRFRSILDGSEYSLTPEEDSDSTLYALEGSRVRIRDLADLMITRSSNLATNVLIELVDPDSVRRTMARLNAQGMRVLRGVEDIPAYRAGLNNTTTAHGLARVLEAIARCEMLSEASCRDILAILERQEFRSGIPAGLPAGTRVANKTGWITQISHDGAIVFPPNRQPYVLVVLTRGITDEAVADRLIADLSRIVWQEVVSP